jgi:hypothetical protein
MTSGRDFDGRFVVEHETRQLNGINSDAFFENTKIKK